MPADGGPVYIIESKHTMLLEPRVAKEDVGKVIGKQGRTAQAIRTLIGAVSSKLKIRTILEIIDQWKYGTLAAPPKDRGAIPPTNGT